MISLYAFSDFNKLDISLGTSCYEKVREGKFENEVMLSDNRYDGLNSSKSIKIDLYSPLLKVENHTFSIGFGFRVEEAVKTYSEYSNLNYLTPVYFTCLYLKDDKYFNFYGKFNLGYEFAFSKRGNLYDFIGYERAKLEGGLYFGVESGIEYKNLILGINYNRSSTKLVIPAGVNQNSGKIDEDFSTIALVLGYRLDFK